MATFCGIVFASGRFCCACYETENTQRTAAGTGVAYFHRRQLQVHVLKLNTNPFVFNEHLVACFAFVYGKNREYWQRKNNHHLLPALFVLHQSVLPRLNLLIPLTFHVNDSGWRVCVQLLENSWTVAQCRFTDSYRSDESMFQLSSAQLSPRRIAQFPQQAGNALSYLPNCFAPPISLSAENKRTARGPKATNQR